MWARISYLPIRTRRLPVAGGSADMNEPGSGRATRSARPARPDPSPLPPSPLRGGGQGGGVFTPPWGRRAEVDCNGPRRGPSTRAPARHAPQQDRPVLTGGGERPAVRGQGQAVHRALVALELPQRLARRHVP